MQESKNQQNEGQILLIDKPRNWTSFDVVKKIRNKLQIKKVGHAGTLDPLATGLLIVCTGKMTKRMEEFMDMEKEYTGTLHIGKTTPSIDLETEFDSECPWTHVKPEDCIRTTDRLTGEIFQVPPMHSAIRIGGKRAYKMARKGEEVSLKSRKIRVTEFVLTGIDLPELKFRVVCSKGTYIRSLVRDFGEHLGTGAYLAELRRTRIGPYHVDNALQIEEINTPA